MDTQTIQVDKIFPNTWNPNVVEEKTQEQLMADIKRGGFNQPIIVRTHPDKEPGNYEIIDGEHRWLAVKGLGWKEVECVVEEKTDAEAMIRTITMNKLRGDFDSLKLAELLVELKKTYSEEELAVLLGFTEEELKSYEELLDFNPEALEKLANEGTDIPEDLVGGNALQLPNELTLSLSLEQLDTIESAIEMTNEPLTEVGLTQICEAFLSNNFPDKYEEVKLRAKKLNIIQNNPNSTELPEDSEIVDTHA